jgi:hypothetical protein
MEKFIDQILLPLRRTSRHEANFYFVSELYRLKQAMTSELLS